MLLSSPVRRMRDRAYLGAAIALLSACPIVARGEDWSCPILPTEHAVTVEPVSGAKTVFVTTDPADDRNLYFHQRSWLADESMMVFRSNRTGRNELFGYLEATGELVRIGRPGDPALNGVTCARRLNDIYAMQGEKIVGLHVDVTAGSGTATHVRVRRRTIADLSGYGGVQQSLTENADGRFLSLAYADPERGGVTRIAAVELETGTVVPMAAVKHRVSHVQFSWTRPDLVMYARGYGGGDRAPEPEDPDAPPRSRIWHVDFSNRPPWPITPQKVGELVTHECWWTEDRLTFCGGHHPHEQNLKVYDMKTGRIRIIGAGSWWPEGTAEQITKRGWWHAAGSPNGRWVVADTFHGDIVLFDANTTEERTLSTGHRVYGSGGAHPHVGWAPSSNRVVFASNKRGNPDVVISYVPKQWK